MNLARKIHQDKTEKKKSPLDISLTCMSSENIGKSKFVCVEVLWPSQPYGVMSRNQFT